jgi:hypothetical protein
LIQPIQDKILAALLSPEEEHHSIVGKGGKVDSEAVRRYARVENDVLANICTHLALTCGITPREFQYKLLLYDSLQHGTLKWRNTFIVDSCLCLGHPDAKKATNKELAECLWVLTHMISMPLSFWIGIMRHVLTELMKLTGDQVSALRDSRIFIRSYPAKPRALDNDVMSGPDVNDCMQRLSANLPVRLTCNLLRTMMTTLLEHCCPALLAKKDSEPVVACPSTLEQGQHEKLAGGVHYVKSLNVPPALGMTLEKARRHMTISRMVQALVGVNQMGEGLDDELLQMSPMVHWRQNRQKALAQARHLVVSHYGLGSRTTCEEVLARCPFIYGDSFNDKVCLFEPVSPTPITRFSGGR